MAGGKRTKLLITLFLLAFAAAIATLCITLQSVGTNNALSVYFLDVGQGDAIYIEAPNGKQMIIDGGPGTALLGELQSYLPAGDRSIDVILNTNPDADHYSGFIPLLERYDIGVIVDPVTINDTALRKTYDDAVAAEDVPHIGAAQGMKIILDTDHNIYYEVLFPDRDVSRWNSNDGSIVGRLVYGETSFMLMGDATARTEGIVRVNTDLSLLQADVLKLGHHGSKTSSTEAWIEAVAPTSAIISAGCDNRYGHPHPEVMARIDAHGITPYGTCEYGTIGMKSDGKSITTKFEKLK